MCRRLTQGLRYRAACDYITFLLLKAKMKVTLNRPNGRNFVYAGILQQVIR